MASSVELIHRSNVFFTACSCVVDVMVFKGPLLRQLQVILFEPAIGIDVPPLILNYPEIVKRLGKNSKQTQLNVVLDSTECADLEQLRTLIRNKAIFDFIVSGLHLVYDEKEEKIVDVDSKFSSKRVELSQDARTLSGAANRVSSFFGKILDADIMSAKIIPSGTAASSKKVSETSFCNRSNGTERSNNHNATNACSPTSETAEQLKPQKSYGSAADTPAKRLAQFFLKRMNSSSRRLLATDSNRSLTETSSSDRIVGGAKGDSVANGEETNCDSFEFLQRSEAGLCTSSPRGSVDEENGHHEHTAASAAAAAGASTGGASTGGAATNCQDRYHPSMHKLPIVRDLVVNTDSFSFEEDEEEYGSGSDKDQDKVGGVAPLSAQQSVLLKPATGACAAGTDADSASWLLGAIMARLSTKKAAVHAE